MKNIKLYEEFLNEGVWAKMMKGVRAGESGPWSIVAIQDKKVAGQTVNIKIKELIPAEYEALKKKHPKAKLHIEDVEGSVVWNESLNETSEAIPLNRKDVEAEYTGNPYMMLSRLQQDCEYFLGNGKGAEKHLHQGSVEKQIAYMKKIWNGLSKKPEWLSMEEIEEYENQMKNYETH